MSILPETPESLSRRRAAVSLAAGLKKTVLYWMETEVHVYGFAIAANVMLSFFPFMIVMVSLCRYVLQWPEAEKAVYLALRDYFPGELGKYIPWRLAQVVAERGPIQFTSLFLLCFTANGVFMPLEVALNRVWGFRENRSFVRNQAISLALIFGCGAMVFASTLMTALNQQLLRESLTPDAPLYTLVGVITFKIAAVPTTILCVLLVYWLLPNGKAPLGRTFPAAVIIGLMLEGLKYVVFAIWPWLQQKLAHEYGVFWVSVSIILYSFVAAMLVLAGAEWSARKPVID